MKLLLADTSPLGSRQVGHRIPEPLHRIHERSPDTVLLKIIEQPRICNCAGRSSCDAQESYSGPLCCRRGAGVWHGGCTLRRRDIQKVYVAPLAWLSDCVHSLAGVAEGWPGSRAAALRPGRLEPHRRGGLVDKWIASPGSAISWAGGRRCKGCVQWRAGTTANRLNGAAPSRAGTCTASLLWLRTLARDLDSTHPSSHAPRWPTMWCLIGWPLAL